MALVFAPFQEIKKRSNLLAKDYINGYIKRTWSGVNDCQCEGVWLSAYHCWKVHMMPKKKHT